MNLKFILNEIYDFLIDLVLLVKLLFVLIFYYLEVLIVNISQFFKKEDLTGKKVLITGAAGGIGCELVEKFLELNCTVICLDKNEKELERIKHKLGPSDRIEIFTVDLCDLDQIKKCCSKIQNEFGPIDILINNAGIVNSGKLLCDLSEDEITRIFNVNIMSCIWMCKQFMPKMIELNQGHIVNVSSVLGLMGAYRLSDYSATKFAVVGFTESIRKEFKKINHENRVTVTLVCPFHVQTDMFNGVEFTRLKWASLSMTPQYVADQIVNGILAKKELVLIPAFWTSIFFAIKNLVTTKFCDYAQEILDINKSTDNYSLFNLKKSK